MDKVNWEQRRYELAKEAMGAMVSNHILLKTIAQTAEDFGEDWKITLTDNAIYLADQMIKQLKRK